MPPRRALSSDHSPVTAVARGTGKSLPASASVSASRSATGSPPPQTTTNTGSPPATHATKRRKIRKGTHSCWACKRKKIRCTFSAPDGTPLDPDEIGDAEAFAGLVCDGCRRRRTPCVSQDLPETTALSAAANHSRHVDDRLGRMEALVEMLVKNQQQQAQQQQHQQYQVLKSSTGRGPSHGSPSTTSTMTSATSPSSSRHRRRQADDEFEREEEGGPDTIGPQRHEPPAAQRHHGINNIPPPETMVSMREGYLAISRTGITTPTDAEEQRATPTTYTTWFGHERGTVMGEEEQPGTMPPKLTGPATPASTASTTATRVGSGSQAGAAGSDADATEGAEADSQSTNNTSKIGGGRGGPSSTQTIAGVPTQNNPNLDAPNATTRAIRAASHMHDEYVRRYNTLAAAWPSPEDLALILDALATPVRSGLHKVLVYTPFSAVLAAQTPPVSRDAASTVLFLPPLGSHLVLVAQKLLMLASFLQHLHPQFDPALRRLKVPHREIMQRAVCATNTVVTGNDSLIGSLEGVQCLVMQGVIQSNQGNLRRAWLAFRRAMTMGQLMGLQRGFPAATIKSIDPGTQQPIVPQCLWFRIVYADRYLSLMLGLPQGAPGDPAVLHPSYGKGALKTLSHNGTQKQIDIPPPPIPASLEGDEAGTAAYISLYKDLRRIEEAHAVIVGRIIERNEAWRGEDDEGKGCGGMNACDVDDSYSDITNVLSTQSIDLALQRASRNMPAQWWLTPQINEWDGDGTTVFMQTQRLVDQLFHYHLLTQLHLPYMLRRGTDTTAKSAAAAVAEETAAVAAEAANASVSGAVPEEAVAGTTMDRSTAHLLRGNGDNIPTSLPPGFTRQDSNSAVAAAVSGIPLNASGNGNANGMGGSAGSVDKYAYSKITCVSASREVLTRFLSLRSFKQVTFFCRCIDFFALLASMTLCLAHLDSHRNEQQQNQMVANDFLAHQRLSDRGMMERVLESMDEMARLNEDDALSAKSAAFLRRMLDVELDASLAVAASLGCQDAQATLRARANEAPDDLRVWVPFLGTIRINKEGILRVNGNECSLVLSSEAKNNNPGGRANGTTNPDNGVNCVIGGPNTENQAKQRQQRQEEQLQKEMQEQQQQQEEQQRQEQERQRQERQQQQQQQFQQQFQMQQQQQQQQSPYLQNGPTLSSLESLLPAVASNPTFNPELIATYPNYSAGETPVVNPLTGLAMVPSWSSVGPLGTTANQPLLFLPNSDPQSSNYMFYTNVADNNANTPTISSTTQGGNFIPSSVATDGSNTGVGGSADDWTLQGVDFAFFENLLMHGGLGDLSSGQTTATNNGSNNGGNSNNNNASMSRTNSNTADTATDKDTPMADSNTTGNVEDDGDNIPISAERRAGHWTWP
ncbi:hypothetical protein Sste5344_006591 [Sporothrix stenoceras]